MNTVLGSAMAGVGNLIAEGNLVKIKNVLWELMFIRFWIAGLIVFCLYYLMTPFITIWLGENYVLSDLILFLILLRIFLQLTNDTVSEFLFGYGLFSDVWASIVQSIIYVILAIIGGYYIGLEGILGGGIISIFLIRGIWKPYFLYTKGLHLSIWFYWKEYLKYLFITFLSFYIASILIVYIWDQQSVKFAITDFILYAVLVCFSFVVINTSLFLVLTKSARVTITRFIKKNRTI